MDEDKKVSLEETVYMTSWTHNTNVNVLGFQPLQLVTGQSVMILGLTIGDMVMVFLQPLKYIKREGYICRFKVIVWT